MDAERTAVNTSKQATRADAERRCRCASFTTDYFLQHRRDIGSASDPCPWP